MKIKKRTQVIIPVFNEERSIENLIPFLKYYNKSAFIFINDGSIDGTKKIVNKYQFNSIDIEENRGKGNAISVGTLLIKAKIGELMPKGKLGLDAEIKIVKPIHYFPTIQNFHTANFKNTNPAYLSTGRRWIHITPRRQTTCSILRLLDFSAMSVLTAT